MSLWLAGRGVSRGIAIGRVQKLRAQDIEVVEVRIKPEAVAAETDRFYQAQKTALQQLRDIRSQIPAGTPGDISAFIEMHLLMLDDHSLKQATVSNIENLRVNAEAALKLACETLVAVFEAMEDPYLRSRRVDVEQVVERVQRVLLQADTEGTEDAAMTSSVPRVVVTNDITPADMILLSQQSVVAFVTEHGSALSHSAILARSLGIPTVVGLRGARKLLRNNEPLIVDGDSGQILASPEPCARAYFEHRIRQQSQDLLHLQGLKDEPAISQDKVSVSLQANIELPEDARLADQNGALGVGLYRTEFLFMNRSDLPSEEEQYEAYSRVVKAVKGQITIRTLDLSADKQVDSGHRHGTTPNNPALGLRAIRLCLHEPDMFKTQIRALLRASAHGQVRLMLPMISTLGEVRQARALIEQCRGELHHQGYACADQIPIGAMIEVPAAAIVAPLLAAEVDFFSIGTNDLIQYTLAIDRVDDEVNYLYDPLHPAVLRLIHMTVQAGLQAGIEVAICGEMGGDSRYTRLLLGMGMNSFSMRPANVPEVKRVIRETNIAQVREEVRRMFGTSDAATFERYAFALAS